MNLNKHLKRLTAFLLLLLCFSLCSCNAGVVSTEPTEAETVTESTLSAEASASDVSTAETSPETATETTGTTAGDTATTTTDTTAAASPDAPPAPATTAPGKAATTTTAKSTTQKAADTCRLTIDCTAAGKGYALQQYEVTLQDGDTAYDILRRGCESNHLTLNAKGTGYGIYVAGINGLDEKEVGENSGWMYYVNGTPPQKACSKYKVHAGDTVLFYYTVDYSTPY